MVTSGPYRFVRRPGCTGVLLIVIGAGLVNSNLIGLGGWTPLILLPLLYRILVEENALLIATAPTQLTTSASCRWSGNGSTRPRLIIERTRILTNP